MSEDPAISPIQALAQRQLAAYNRTDIDAFCACFHDDVVVMEADGEVIMRGMAEFRPGYTDLFTNYRDVVATVPRQMAVGDHCIDHALYSRTHAEIGESSGGARMVRYSLRDHQIGWMQSLMCGAAASGQSGRGPGWRRGSVGRWRKPYATAARARLF